MSSKKLDEVLLLDAKKNKSIYKEIFAQIKKYDDIVVFRHIKPDFDALGSQIGLATFIKDNFPNKNVYVVGDNHVSFTPRLFREMDTLPDSFYEKKFLAIVVDVGDKDRIANPRYEEADYIIKIDHHPYKEQIANISIDNTEAAAAAELVTAMLLNFKGTKISPEAAKNLYIALVGDSGRFLYSSTTPFTFSIANALLATGFDMRKTYLDMYEKTINSLHNQAYVLTHFSVSPHGVAYYCLDTKTQEELKITPELGKENVNLFANIEGINAWCSITEDPNPKDYCWRISIRSKEKDISGVARAYGGGGHAQASGARIDSLKDLDKFIGDLDKLFE
ncbi:MAG: bifunctional oligoribonuclease/PAP phosphatase NrnA [Bacilli bacterium]|nr:bifunctional oligoribonuclease/PAP phosphatase NrnA [Bacilli bacterium]MDY6430552.1 bifunctional oligoribonuclease/PAP phosphatase NrnA [Bacilli bacterium]